MPYLRPRTLEQREAWAEQAASAGRRGTQRIVEAGEVTPSDLVAELLRLRSGEAAVVRRRVIYLDDTPIEMTDSYYPAAIARGSALTDPQPIRGGAVTLLASLGHLGRRVVEEVAARLPTEQERHVLTIDTGDPILMLTRVVFDSHDEPIQADVMIAPARAQRLRYEMVIG
ncbi:GntR family transcriptional regulator [Acrocarpospora macrocephala]|uniref:GntR family transcriptional regulator n=1 Tax=Acrocarpospora macrocephala TaxID=150177 RepID=UPI0024835342|nr:UTRA domain-containing protein [Acrocarpospora macrocephala]